MDDVGGNDGLLTELASRLSAALATVGFEPVDLRGRAKLLRIARDVAHATERQNAPLAAYMIGRFVQDAARSGISEADALDQAGAVVRTLIGESD